MAGQHPPKNDDLARAVEAALPKSLYDIIRQDRERYLLAMAMDEDLALLAGEADGGPIRDTLDDWRVVLLRDAQHGQAAAFLVGESQRRGGRWGTSPILAIDLGRGRARTQNSIYGLGRRGIGEPPLKHLLHVCALLHGWGIGDPLGVPHVSY